MGEQQESTRPLAELQPGSEEYEALASLTYEEAIQSLEQVVGRLESTEISLDESMALFRRGMALTEICAGKLAAIEKQISQLVEKADGQVEEKPFGEENG